MRPPPPPRSSPAARAPRRRDCRLTAERPARLRNAAWPRLDPRAEHRPRRRSIVPSPDASRSPPDTAGTGLRKSAALRGGAEGLPDRRPDCPPARRGWSATRRRIGGAPPGCPPPERHGFRALPAGRPWQTAASGDCVARPPGC